MIGSNSCGERERETTLLTDKAVQFATAETCVFSDPVLCLGRISPELLKLGKVRSSGLWNHAISEYWVGSTENRWNARKIFLGFTTLGILDEIQKMMTELMCEPEHFQARIIFMSTMTLIGENEETKKIVLRMLTDLLNILEN